MRKFNISYRFFIVLILIFSTFYSFAIPQKSQEQIDVENLIRMGWQLYDRGEIDKALKIFNRVLENCKKFGFREGEAVLNWSIAEILKIKGEFILAKNHYEISLEISRDIGDRKSEAMNLSSLGNLLSLDMGDNSRALVYYREALKIYRNMNDKVRENYELGSIGYVYLVFGDYSKALEYFKQSLKLSREINNKKFEYEALEFIGDVYVFLKDTKKAINYFNLSLKIANEIDDPKYKKAILRKYGTLNELQGNYSEALECFEKGLKISIISGDKKEQSNFQGNIAGIYEKLGQYSKALQYYKGSLENYREINETYMEGLVLLKIGSVYNSLNNNLEAMKYTIAGLKITASLDNRYGLLWGFYHAGIAHMNRGDNDMALSYLKHSISTLESVRKRIQEEKYRIFYFGNNDIIYERIILLLSYLNLKKQHNDFAKEAFIYTEKSKARALLEMLAEAKFGLRMGLSKKDIEYENFLYRNIEKLRNSRRNATKEDVIKVYRKLRTAEEKLEEFKIEISRTNPLYASVQYPQPITIEEVQNRILKDKKEALLEYYIGNENSFIFVITKKEIRLLSLGKNNSEFAKDIEKLRRPFRRIEESIVELNKFDLTIAQNLYQELIAPAVPYLKGIKNIVVVPHGCLHYLPFEILVSQIDEKDIVEKGLLPEYGTPRYLIEDYSISYAPSASVLDPKLYIRETDNPKKGDILAIANPDFREVESGKPDETITNLILTKSMRERIQSLPYSEMEVGAIKKFFRNPFIYKNKHATEENFIEQSPYYPIIHLSTHGFLNETSPIYSSLVFAYNEAIKDVDLLHAYEVFNLDLNCDLVTLSACETTLEQKIEYVGGEGVVGLSRAFLYAGAKSLVVSLWKVEDESTSILMSEFYRNLKEKGLSKIEALRQAKLVLMKKEKKIGKRFLSYSHPFFWAPFILIGEPK